MLKRNFLTRELALLWLIGVLVTVVVEPSALTQEKNQFAGKWKANLTKSQRHPNHQFQSLTVQFELTEDAVLLTFTGVNMSGKQESGTSKLHPDGKEYPIAEAREIVVITKWVGTRILESAAKKDGKVIGHSTYEISSDGKELTAKIKGVDAKGESFEQVIVFDRE